MEPQEQSNLHVWIGRLLTRASIARIEAAVTAHDAAVRAMNPEPERKELVRIVEHRVRAILDVRFQERSRSGVQVWSEAQGRMMSSSEFTSFIPEELLTEIKAASDYPDRKGPNPGRDVYDIGQMLKVVFSTLAKDLPLEDGDTKLGPQSRAAGAFRTKLVGLFGTPEVWVKHAGDAHIQPRTERASLASRARDLSVRNAGTWEQVHSSVNVFVRREANGPGATVRIGLRYDVLRSAIKGHAIESVSDQRSLAVLLGRYGLADETGPDPFAQIDGKRVGLVVLARALTEHLLFRTDAVHVSATQ